MARFSKAAASAALLSVLLLTVVSPALAFEGRSGDTVTIAASEVVNDDLYIGVNQLFMEGTINGDLIAAGETLTIDGTVNGNLIAAGQTIVVNGTVTGDVLAGGSVLLFGESASVGGDVVAAGYSVELRNGGSVGRDAVLGAAQIVLAADIARDVRAGTGALEVGGRIGRNAYAYVGEAGEVMAGPPPTVFMPASRVQPPVVRQGLTIDKDAKIAGNLVYTQNNELAFPAGVVAGAVTRLNQPETSEHVVTPPTPGERVGKWALASLRAFVTLVLVALLMLALMPRLVGGSAAELRAKPWPSIGWGVVAYPATAFVMMLVLFAMILGAIVFGILSLGGLAGTVVWIGILAMFALTVAFVLATAFVAKIVFGAAVGEWLLTRTGSALAGSRYWPTLVGIAITVVVVALLKFPLAAGGGLGWLLNFVVILFGLGGLWLWLRRSMSKATPAPTSG